MNKAALVELVRRELGKDIGWAEAERAVRGVLEAIKKGLHHDGSVQLIGFGTFKVHERPARSATNPRTGVKMKVPPTRTIKFSPGKNLKNRL